MPSHQDRREPLPADYQYGGMTKDERAERERKIALVVGLLNRSCKALNESFDQALDDAERAICEGR